jgi:hypothetical protein
MSWVLSAGPAATTPLHTRGRPATTILNVLGIGGIGLPPYSTMDNIRLCGFLLTSPYGQKLDAPTLSGGYRLWPET